MSRDASLLKPPTGQRNYARRGVHAPDGWERPTDMRLLCHTTKTRIGSASTAVRGKTRACHMKGASRDAV